jgi:hypothetical protein
VLRLDGRLVFPDQWGACRALQPPRGCGRDPARECLQRSSFGMHRFEWDDDACVECHFNHGDMIRLLRSGFEIEDLIELRAPAETGQADPLCSRRLGLALAR